MPQIEQGALNPEALADLALALSWLVGLKDERPADYEEQKPLAWAAARAALAKARALPGSLDPYDTEHMADEIAEVIEEEKKP